MPAPTEPRSDADPTDSLSARANPDETVSAARSAPSVSAETGFGPPLATGEVGALGPYRVVKELGHGGMGAVYAAVDTRLDRRLALKVMLPQFASDAQAKGRFLREARAAARINHDNVVTIYEADERGGVPYIAMQFLEGYPLDVYLKKKGVPAIPQIVRIAAEAASGLKAAHDIGLVHRDVKPANLWLEAPNGRVKVLDFGLAKPVDAEVELTQSGAVVGTPAYMSPEQARGEKVDARTDLFSLGSVLYRLCAGKLPFSGPTTMAVLMALGTEEPRPVREVNPAVPESLAALIHQLLSKRADDRPQSAVEVVKRLREIADELAGPPRAELSASLPQAVAPSAYIATPVTVVPEANPFADIDAPDAQSDADRTEFDPDAEPKPKSVAKSPGPRWLWPAVGLAALLAVVAVGGVVIATRKKGETEPKVEAPAPTPGAPKDKGKTPAGPEKSVADTPVTAARWLLDNKKLGSIRVEVNGLPFDAQPSTLPAEPFRVRALNFHPNNNGGKLVADDYPRLAAFTDLEDLILSRQTIDARGLEVIAGLKSLRKLDLIYATVPDGLGKAVRKLPHLEFYAGPSDDAVLKDLAGMPTLRSVLFYGTAPSEEAMGGFKDYPNLQVLHFEGHPLTETGLRKLTAVKGLRLLKIEAEQVKPAFAERLAADMPWCEVWYFTDLNARKYTVANERRFGDDRALAEWVIGQGGSVRVNSAAESYWAVAELPQLPFALTFVQLRGTAVTDESLERLKVLKSLTRLHLQKTAVTAKGLEAFAAALPACQIVHDGGAIGPKVVATPDRAVAEWVIGQGWSVTVDVAPTGPKEVMGLADLPKDAFVLTRVQLSGEKVTDGDLARIKACKGLALVELFHTSTSAAGLLHLQEIESLKNLTLYGTKVADSDLVHLKGIKKLSALNLAFAQVSDAGLAHLKELDGLTHLYVHDTAVSDAGLEHLKGLKKLTVLNVKNTKVTAKGLEALHAALPVCEIEHSGGTIEPKK